MALVWNIHAIASVLVAWLAVDVGVLVTADTITVKVTTPQDTAVVGQPIVTTGALAAPTAALPGAPMTVMNPVQPTPGGFPVGSAGGINPMQMQVDQMNAQLQAAHFNQPMSPPGPFGNMNTMSEMSMPGNQFMPMINNGGPPPGMLNGGFSANQQVQANVINPGFQASTQNGFPPFNPLNFGQGGPNWINQGPLFPLGAEVQNGIGVGMLPPAGPVSMGGQELLQVQTTSFGANLEQVNLQLCAAGFNGMIGPLPIPMPPSHRPMGPPVLPGASPGAAVASMEAWLLVASAPPSPFQGIVPPGRPAVCSMPNGASWPPGSSCAFAAFVLQCSITGHTFMLQAVGCVTALGTSKGFGQHWMEPSSPLTLHYGFIKECRKAQTGAVSITIGCYLNMGGQTFTVPAGCYRPLPLPGNIIATCSRALDGSVESFGWGPHTMPPPNAAQC